MSKIMCILTVLGVLAYPMAGQAFKFKTHIFVAQQVLNDVIPDGRVTIEGREYVVPHHVHAALSSQPDIYRMGHVGPDGFPDLLVGQQTTHPGVKNGWRTDHFLAHLLNNAGQDQRATAFTYGYLGHAAGDTFAHTYVNTYTGDVFDLSDGETTVERRHMALEAFIESKTPELTDHLGRALGPAQAVLSVPTGFVADALILSPEIVAQYQKVGASTMHLVAMQRAHLAVTRLAKHADSLGIELTQKLSYLDGLQLQAGAEADKYIGLIATTKLQVDAARALVEQYRRTLDTQEQAVNAAERAFSVAEDAATQAATLASQASQMFAHLERKFLDLQQKLLNTPQHVVSETCKNTWLRVAAAASTIGQSELVCRNSKTVNRAWQQLSGMVIEAERKQIDARRGAEQYVARHAAELQNRAAKLATLESARRAVSTQREFLANAQRWLAAVSAELNRWEAAKRSAL